MPVIPNHGQIWRDPRNPAREVEMVENRMGLVKVKNTATGRISVLSYENFTILARKPWIFVRDAPGERAKLVSKCSVSSKTRPNLCFGTPMCEDW